MTTYNTPYKSGAITAISGATLTVSGMTPAAGDVGRILVLSSGVGQLQHREITAVSGQNITLAHAFNTNPFIDDSADSRGSDVNPSVSDAFVISYDVADLISGDADISLDDQNHLIIANLIATNGAYIHFKNYHVQISSTQFKCGTGGGVIFGYYNYVAGEDGYTKDACHIVDTAGGTGEDQFRENGGSSGLLDIYGGSVYCPNNNFWRRYNNSYTGVYQTRIFDVNFQGGIGGRIDGDRSMLNLASVGNPSNFGIFNTLPSVFRIEQAALANLQAGYVSFGISGAGRSVYTRLADITGQVIRVASNSSIGNQVYEVIAKKSEIDSAPTFINVDSPGDATHTFRYGNLIKPRFIKQDLSLLTGNISVDVIDVNGTIVETQSVTTGEFAPIFARHTDIASVTGNLDLSDGTQYAPYTLTAFKYGYEFISQAVSLEDTFDPDIIALPDALISESNKAVVDAYPYLNNAYQLYDAASSWLEDNKTDELGKVLTREGGAVDFGNYSVLFDKTATALFDIVGGTIVARVDIYTGLVKTTDTFATANGAVQSGGVISVDGDSFLTFESIDSWIVYASAANRDSNASPLDSGTGSESYRFNYSGGTTYYLRLTTGTDTIFKDVTPAASGETVVSLGTSALLGNINASIQESSKLAEYDGRATIDLIDGTDSTVHPYGTVKEPALSIANALVIAADIGVKRIEIRGDASALPQEIVGYRFEAGFSNATGAKQYPALTMSALNGAKNCEFDGFEITGALDDSTDQIFNEFRQCVVKNLAGVAGLIERSKLAGIIQVTHSLDIKDSYGTFVLNASGANANVSVPDFSGAITVAGMNSANARVNLGFVAGLVIIDSSCTAGEITIANQNQIVGAGGGVTVTIIEEAGGAGEADWTASERAQIRDALGVDGTKITATGGQLQSISGGGDDAATIYTYFTDGVRADAFKATGFSTFDPLTTSVTVSAIENNVITASTIANNAFTNSAFTVGYYNTINSELGTALEDYDAPTKAELDAGLAALQAHGDLNWQTATGFSTLDQAGVLAALNTYGASTFDPSTDEVAQVALCVENSDMRGTDGANTVAPDNTTIASISATVGLLAQYHDNDSGLFLADGTTPATPLTAQTVVTFGTDGTTPLKTVRVLGTDGNPTTLPNWSRYEKL